MWFSEWLPYGQCSGSFQQHTISSKEFAHERNSNLFISEVIGCKGNNGLRQCTELILMISGQHPCNNYTVHISPHFARVTPLNLFACIMRDLNEGSSFINDVIYIYDQCALVLRACHQRAQDEHCLSVSSLTGLSGEGEVPLESHEIKAKLL